MWSGTLLVSIPTLVVSANFAFAHIKGVARDPKDYEVYRKKEYTQEPPDELKQRVKENQKKLKKIQKTEINTYGDDDWPTPTEEEVITLDGGEIEVTVEPTKEQMEELEVHEGKKFQKGLDTVIQVMEEEEKEKERIIEVSDDGGHKIIMRDKPKEDIYKDKPKSNKPDLGRTPNPVRKPNYL